MRVLLVWDENPERVVFFEIDDPTEKQLRMLEMANGKYINGDEENEGLLYVNAAVYEPDDFSDEDHAGIWASKEVETPVEGPIDRVFLSGFML
jgi:hypothetical protein